MITNSSQPVKASSINIRDDLNKIYNEASNFMLKRMGDSMDETIESDRFLEELRNQLTKELKNPNLNRWMLEKAFAIGELQYEKGYNFYKQDLWAAFPNEDKKKIQSIEDNARLAFARTKYIIIEDLMDEMRNWLKDLKE